jgi:hypothetical protein
MKTRFVFFMCFMSFMCFTSAFVTAGVAQLRSVLVNGIEINGVKRLSPAQVIALSGLRTGEAFTPATMQASIDRLIAVGVFSNVRCHYDAARGGLVVFDIEEHAWTLPVTLDNFIWWTDAELTAGIARALPTYDGTAPQTNEVVKTIIAALDAMIKEKNLPGHAEYMPSVRQDGSDRRHRFQVAGIALPVCAIHFPKASSVPEADLVKRSGAVMGQSYWRRSIDSLVPDTLLPFYQSRGFVEAVSAGPTVTRYITTPACPSGVDVTVPIDEGPQYKMGNVTATGLPEADAKKLVRAWPLKAGKVFDATVVNQFRSNSAVRQVAERYRSKRLTITPTPNREHGTVDVLIEMK